MPTDDARLVLKTDDGSAEVEVAPSMGALVTRLTLANRPILYLDEASLTSTDPKVSKRGGVPVLFPSPGTLKSGMFEAEGRYGALKNHGFARDMPFEVVSQEAHRLLLKLEANDKTLAHFPWDFLLEIAISIEPSALRYAITIANQDEETMPCAFGLHPYFLVTDKSQAVAQTGATRAFDNRTKRHVDVPPRIDFTQGEVDMHLVDHWTSHLDLMTEAGTVRVSASEAFRTWVLWTLPGRDFVCVEPWTSPGDALNSKKDLLVLSPGERRELSIAFELPGAEVDAAGSTKRTSDGQ